MTKLNKEYLENKYGKEKLVNVKKIDVSNSKLNAIEANTFEGLSNLEELELSNNELKKIDSNTLKPLGKLMVLKLNKCEIADLDANVFAVLANEKTNISGWVDRKDKGG